MAADAPSPVPPSLGAASFSCPRCGAFADQSWFRVFAHWYDEKSPPKPLDVAILQFLEKDADEHPDEPMRRRLVERYRRRFEGDPVLIKLGESDNVRFRVDNVDLSRCRSCGEVSLWLCERVIFPESQIIVRPNPDMPGDVKADFNEAAGIVDRSTRGAAALLRLAIQKLCIQLGLPGKNLNRDIAALVARGLDQQIQMMLDAVRVIGNDSVHPGEIDMKDDRETALQLFFLVNEIVDEMISKPQRVKALYDRLPETKRQAIEQRDKPKLPPPTESE